MDNKKEFAKTNYENKIFRDSLLSMLEPSFEQAKLLLSDNGILFCNIDDRNHSYVKLLLDSIFRGKNFYGNIVQCKGNTQNDSKTIQRNTDYILTYSKTYKELLLTYENHVDKKVFEE